MPYLEAFMAEIQRHVTIAPMGAHHTPTRDTQLLGYQFPKGQMITFNLFEIMRDPKHFPDPEKFDPDRFLKDGKFQGNPALVGFSMGKRECLGKLLAKQELFLFTSNLLHQFTFEPGTKGPIPDLDQGTVSITRLPEHFTVRAIPK